MRTPRGWLWIWMMALAIPAYGKVTLFDAAARAKQALSAHDAEGLVGASSNLVLQIPGADPSSPLGRSQAIELLRRYFRPAEERGLDVTAIRVVEPGRGFVDLTRRYPVARTTEFRRETLFLGDRLLGNACGLGELRTPA